MIYALLMGIFILFIIFFSSTEIALISANPIRIRHLAKYGNRRAHQTLSFFSHPEDYIATILIGTNLFAVAITVIATRAFSYYWGFTGKVLTTFIVSFLILIFGEIIPKSFSRTHANSVSIANFPLLKLFHILFLPLSWIVRLVSQLLLFRVEDQSQGMFKEEMSKEKLTWTLNKARLSDKVKKIDKSIFSKIFRFSEKPVSEVMIPRTEMKMIRYPFKVKDVLRMTEMTGLSRFPVFRKTPDCIIGLVTVKDIFLKEHEKMSNMVTPVTFVPPNKRCDSLLTELREEPALLAIVVNEYGETEGLVTLEDLIEELFGEIADEFDLQMTEEKIKQLDGNSFIVSGLSRIEEINEELNLQIPEGEYDTISGFIMDRLKELPVEDQHIEEEEYVLIVKEMDGQKIKKVILRMKEPRIS